MPISSFTFLSLYVLICISWLFFRVIIISENKPEQQKVQAGLAASINESYFSLSALLLGAQVMNKIVFPRALNRSVSVILLLRFWIDKQCLVNPCRNTHSYSWSISYLVKITAVLICFCRKHCTVLLETCCFSCQQNPSFIWGFTDFTGFQDHL